MLLCRKHTLSSDESNPNSPYWDMTSELMIILVMIVVVKLNSMMTSREYIFMNIVSTY